MTLPCSMLLRQHILRPPPMVPLGGSSEVPARIIRDAEPLSQQLATSKYGVSTTAVCTGGPVFSAVIAPGCSGFSHVLPTYVMQATSLLADEVDHFVLRATGSLYLTLPSTVASELPEIRGFQDDAILWVKTVNALGTRYAWPDCQQWLLAIDRLRDAAKSCAQLRRRAATVLASMVTHTDFCFSAAFAGQFCPHCQLKLSRGCQRGGTLSRHNTAALYHPPISR
ncbi:hypothetical protein HPB51_027753 [Rhipicephalus microplus]|uniref:Uncharacterized protein n=1 Tax=Rhipicephalus microplus TaxID=6941 RepID=A0A9J6CZG0_RHIMP|nr:hypothetical protein HPB51_027753 [Rhipicephalus microplus]